MHVTWSGGRGKTVGLGVAAKQLVWGSRQNSYTGPERFRLQRFTPYGFTLHVSRPRPRNAMYGLRPCASVART